MGNLTAPRLARFGDFVVDLASGDIEGPNGRERLQDQPFRVLKILIEKPGELITRDELRRLLWPGDTFVNFDNALCTAVKKLRRSLQDSRDAPRFVETLPKKGYRFIAAVEYEGEVEIPDLQTGGQVAASTNGLPPNRAGSAVDQLQDENRRLKNLVVELTLERERLREICHQHSISA